MITKNLNSRPTTIENNDSERAKNFRKRLTDSKLLDSSWLKSRSQDNGQNRKFFLRDVWFLYQKDHLPTISESSRISKKYRCNQFLPPLYNLKMHELTPQVISELIHISKEEEERKQLKRRFNFERELRDLRSILNWYSANHDFRFVNPVNSGHYKLSVIREIPFVQRQISQEQIQKFLDQLPAFYRDIATMEFYCGARIGEIAGLQWKNVDFARRILKIQEVIVWIGNDPKIKAFPKNGSSREVFINFTMMEILKRYFDNRASASPFVFHRKGKPLLYSVICANFNRAWIRAELPQYRGAHILRYGSSQLGRRLTGSIDGAKALTGHKSFALANQYSEYSCIDQNRDVVEKLEVAMNAGNSRALLETAKVEG